MGSGKEDQTEGTICAKGIVQPEASVVGTVHLINVLEGRCVCPWEPYRAGPCVQIKDPQSSMKGEINEIF